MGVGIRLSYSRFVSYSTVFISIYGQSFQIFVFLSRYVGRVHCKIECSFERFFKLATFKAFNMTDRFILAVQLGLGLRNLPYFIVDVLSETKFILPLVVEMVDYLGSLMTKCSLDIEELT